ncbi:MAG: sigma 54-interacting transcriptional regulator [Pseudomonadota bacterium]
MRPSTFQDGCPPQMAGTDVITRPISADEKNTPVPHGLGQRHQLLVWLDEAVQPWPLPEQGDVVVGRATESDIQIDSAAVSRRHARLTVRSDSVRVADLGSRNGTRVNGERLVAERTLSYGDIVTFGDVTSVLGEDRRQGTTPAHGSPLLEAQAPPPQVLILGDRTALVADPAMAHVYTQLARLAPTDLSVLIMGETGAGKELAARALRLWSKRSNRPLVSINCAALPPELAESELFGYERGAFSGAVGAKQGLLEAADGGTVLLDEIGDLPPAVQAKLLRVIETRCLTRLGSVHEHAIDVRVIAATHRDLEEGVRKGWFRADLYYRLGVAIVRIPPLRLRRRELPLLARTFVDDACRMLGRGPLGLAEDALACLLAHDWPGNVRELKNLIDCLVVEATGSTITAASIGARFQHGNRSAETPAPAFRHDEGGGGVRSGFSDETAPFRPLAQANRDFERRTIEAALVETNGNKTHAAKRLGVPLRTFMDKVKRYGL